MFESLLLLLVWAAGLPGGAVVEVVKGVEVQLEALALFLLKAAGLGRDAGGRKRPLPPGLERGGS